MKLKRAENTVKNFVFGGLNKLIAIFFPFIIRTIIINNLGIQYLGLSSLYTSILNVLSIAELGFGTALVYSMYKPLAEDNVEKVNALLNLYKKIYQVVGCVVLVVGVAISPFLKYLIKGSYPSDINLYTLYFIFLANNVIGYFFFAYRNAILVVHQRNDINSKITSVITILMYVVQMIVLFLFKNYYIYIIFMPLSTLAINLFIAFITRKKYPQFKPRGGVNSDEKKQIKKQITALFTHRIGYVIQSSIDNICISAFLGLAFLGKFNNYYYIITALESFFIILKQSLLAGVGNSVAVENLETNRKLFYKLFFANMWIVGWCTCCLMCLYQPFMNLWVGTENLLSNTMMFSMVIMFYLNNTRSTIGTFKDALGMWWQDRFKPIGISVVNLVGTLISLRFGFVEGVIIATTLSYVIVGIPWETAIFYKGYLKEKQSKYYLKHLCYTLVNVFAVVATYMLCKLIPGTGVLKIALNFGVCLVVPNLIYLLAYFRTKEFKSLMQMSFIKKMRSKMLSGIKLICSKVKNVFNYTISLFFYLVPIKKNKITAYNFNGNGYGDNPKYLCDELLKDKKYKIYWITKKVNSTFPEGVTPIKYGSLKALYHMITARLWLDNVRNNPKPLFKRKNQCYIQMWHGGIFIKGQEKDAENTLSKKYIKAAKKDSKMADYILSNCKKRTELIKSAFWYDGEILEFGIPRDDILFDLENEKIKEVKEKYNLQDKKIVLYAPSFRTDRSFYKNLKFDVKLLLEELNKKFNNEFVFCFKFHPNDSDIKAMFKDESFIDFNSESDSQLILAASDVVISDYSSMLLDFSLTGRLTLTYAPDYDNYINTDRKLYLDLKACGIPFAETFEELLTNIKNYDQKEYQEKIKKFYEYYEVFENGNSAEKIKDYLVENGVL